MEINDRDAIHLRNQSPHVFNQAVVLQGNGRDVIQRRNRIPRLYNQMLMVEESRNVIHLLKLVPPIFSLLQVLQFEDPETKSFTVPPFLRTYTSKILKENDLSPNARRRHGSIQDTWEVESQYGTGTASIEKAKEPGRLPTRSTLLACLSVRRKWKVEQTSLKWDAMLRNFSGLVRYSRMFKDVDASSPQWPKINVGKQEIPPVIGIALSLLRWKLPHSTYSFYQIAIHYAQER
ncbi:hypothetical protein AVEN_51788-1 [Araneus ventricosus]|uniref:Uncharacterized protein n=1 Tax=Araneus ventricosus TaxID=182803 RepID=A0A4Y2M464_ARAVE|nr:hypothetical protein AVEN_51788-1 [Araneus ventricosus]